MFYKNKNVLIYIRYKYLLNFILQTMPLQSGKVQGKHLFSGYKDIPEESREMYGDYIASYLKAFQPEVAR